MEKYIDIAVAELAEEVVLITAPLNALCAGDLVDIGDGALFEVKRKMAIVAGGNEHQFLTLAHGGETYEAKRIFRCTWEAADEQAG